MDDFNSFPDQGYSYSPSYSAPVVNSYAESYNYATTDPIAISIRHDREYQERLRREEEEAAWTRGKAFNMTSGYQGTATATTTAYIKPDAYNPDAPHSYLAAKAAGQKYYYLPGEPRSWRRPVSTPSGQYDAMWWKTFCNADDLSMDLANELGYVGARDEDGWIRPTRLELLRMGFKKVQRYASAYAEFAEEFGLKIPKWVQLLRPTQAGETTPAPPV